jgi:hypothetical protein
MYSRNGRSNRPPCPSRRRNGSGRSSLRGETPKSSIHLSIAAIRLLVMDPFSVQHMQVGTFLPLKIHVGPMGNSRSHPPLYFSCPLFSFKVPGSSMSVLKGLNPEASMAVSIFAATVTSHITGSLDAAVNPRTVKWQSLYELRS